MNKLFFACGKNFVFCSLLLLSATSCDTPPLYLYTPRTEQESQAILNAVDSLLSGWDEVYIGIESKQYKLSSLVGCSLHSLSPEDPLSKSAGADRYVMATELDVPAESDIFPGANRMAFYKYSLRSIENDSSQVLESGIVFGDSGSLPSIYNSELSIPRLLLGGSESINPVHPNLHFVVNKGGCKATDPSVLESYVNKDLRKATPEELRPIRQALRIPESELCMGGRAPWYVWKTKEGDQARYIMVEVQGLFSVPGTSSVMISLFDQTGRRIGSWPFSTGYRIYINNATFTSSRDLDTKVITIQTSRMLGRDVARQVFAFSGDVLRFIRIEDSKSNLICNRYRMSQDTLGVSVKEVTEEEWISMLKSENPVEVLAALVFLGGEHRAPPTPEKDPCFEDIHQVKLFERLRNSSVVNELVQKHSQSTIDWIREAAEMVRNEKV